MRALAHPSRLALLDHLHSVDSATATECAAVVGESPSALSYHLRALARWGFVEEAPGGVGRERPWRATATRIEFPDGTVEAAGLRDELVVRAHRAVREALDASLPPRWRRAIQTSFATLDLTPAQLEQLGERFEALLDEYRGRETSGAETVIVS